MSRYRASATILPRVAFHPVVSGCSAREYLPRRVYLDIFRVWVNHCLAEAAVCSPAPAPTAKSPISEITTAEINNLLGAPRKPHSSIFPLPPFVTKWTNCLATVMSHVTFVIIIVRSYLTRLNVILLIKTAATACLVSPHEIFAV